MICTKAARILFKLDRYSKAMRYYVAYCLLVLAEDTRESSQVEGKDKPKF